MDTIGKRLKHLRQKLNISMVELAHSLDIRISSSTISNIENDKHSPNAEIIIALCSFFNVSADWLLTGKNFNFTDNMTSINSDETVEYDPNEVEKDLLQLSSYYETLSNQMVHMQEEIKVLHEIIKADKERLKAPLQSNFKE